MSIYSKAHDKGYDDYEQDKSEFECPFAHPDMRDAWKDGWHEARSHRFDNMDTDDIYDAGHQAGFLAGKKARE